MATAAVGFQNATDIVFDMNTATTAATETFTFTATRSGKIIGVTVLAKASAVGGAIEVKCGGATVVSGLACAVANAVTLASTIAVANQVYASGTSIAVVVSTVGTQGLIIIHTEPTTYANQTTLTAT